MSPSAPDENADSAADMLAEGVESCNPEMIREAVARGARVDQLRGRKVTPLEVALNKCLRFAPQAQDCIATLVELGCSIDGEPDGTPTVLECTAHHREEGDALRLLKVVVPLGANVNAVDPSTGDTALARSVARNRLTIVHFLLDHHADPTIKNAQGISAIDWLQARIADTSQMFSECWKHRNLLSLITSEPIPPSEIVRPQLAECLSVDLANVTADARFFCDLKGAADDLRHFTFEIQKKLGVSIEPVIDQITALCDVNDDGKLTADSLTQIASYLPGWSAPSEPIELADLWTVSMIEAIVQFAVDNGAAPPDTVGESLGETWTEDLHREIGDRGFRLLLAGSCRYAFKPYIKSRPTVPTRLALDAIETLERFADTGKGKPALRKAQKDMKETFGRGYRDDQGIHASFALDISLNAPQYVWKMIEERFGLSGIQALREFVRQSRDVCPLESHGCFENAWRTPEVVEIATRMYETRDFREMFRLANALQGAGCNDKSILNHCRDPQRIHIRGCWLVDAILNGSWATPPKAKKQKKTLLSRLPKSAQLTIAARMDHDGALPLEEFLKNRWNVEAYSRSFLYGDASKRLNEALAKLSELHPELTDEQIRILLSLETSIKGLKETAVARRAVLGDPSELARGLSVMHRLGFALRGHRANYREYQEYLELCAIREMSVAQTLVAVTRAGHQAIPSDWQLADIAILAILQADFDTLEMVTREMAKHKVGSWLRGFYTSLTGVATAQPKAVASGLQLLLEGMHKMRNKGDEDCVINLQAQGLYRLFEWVDRDLVADFDVRQAFPWDAEFHQWCESHPDPLEGVDLNHISEVLHDIVVLRRPPAWLPEPAALYEVVLIDGDSNSRALADEVGGLAGAANIDASKQIMKSCPVTLRWNLDQQSAERFRREIEELGGSAEATIMQPIPFRFIESVR